MSTSTATRRHESLEPDAPSTPGVGPLGRLAGAAFRHRGRVVLIWLAVLAVAGVLSTVAGGTFHADYSAPGSDSQIAQQQLQQRFPAQSGDTVNVVVHSDSAVTSPAVKADVTKTLAQLKSAKHVAGIDDPYTTPGSISPDGHTLIAHGRLDVVNPNDMPVSDAKKLVDIAKHSSANGVQISLGGQSIEQAEQGSIGSEGLGIAAAAIILLLMFGAVVAAGLPILVAVSGLAVSSMLTGIIIAFIDAPDWSTSLATMMGIGIGIDYALLMVTRFREWRAAGLDPEKATIATLDTAGRAVLVAGSTVVVSMLGLFAMGLSFMRGAAVVTITSVLVVMAAAVTLFPAILGYLGQHIDRLRLPLGHQAPTVAVGGHLEPSRRWLAWSRFVARRRIPMAIGAVVVLLALASPFLGVRFGFPDAGNDQSGMTTRQAYDATSTAFGPGANGPLLLAAELPAGAKAASLDGLSAALKATPGVAAVTPVTVNPAGNTAVLSVIPTTGPQSPKTEALVHQLRDVTIPQATANTGVTVHVGGVTATSIDSTANIAKRIPLLIGGVVLLSMILLLVSFRSVVVALKAAAMNLLSVAAAYGVVALVLQGGWAGKLVGIDHESPLPAFVPVLMFAVLFGLSMDYEVFLVSRMRETWMRTRDNNQAIVQGLAGTGRVITAAAAIMVAVFAAFVPSPNLVLKVIGIGMASAIFIDATIVRMILVPAVMHLLGRRNWWMPARFERIVPELYVEGHPEVHLPEPSSGELDPTLDLTASEEKNTAPVPA
jgi:RND superfamily putative drug exporter